MNREPSEEDKELMRDWLCPLCSSTRPEEEWVMLGGRVRLVSQDCGAGEEFPKRGGKK